MKEIDCGVIGKTLLDSDKLIKDSVNFRKAVKISCARNSINVGPFSLFTGTGVAIWC